VLFTLGELRKYERRHDEAVFVFLDDLTDVIHKLEADDDSIYLVVTERLESTQASRVFSTLRSRHMKRIQNAKCPRKGSFEIPSHCKRLTFGSQVRESGARQTGLHWAGR
jgi:hypothetical protein